MLVMAGWLQSTALAANQALTLLVVVEQLLLHPERIVHELATFEGVVFMMMNLRRKYLDFVFVVVIGTIVGCRLHKRVHSRVGLK